MKDDSTIMDTTVFDSTNKKLNPTKYRIMILCGLSIVNKLIKLNKI
jgi:hypothetical protein